MLVILKMLLRTSVTYSEKKGEREKEGERDKEREREG
jgi:hypothetical protein